MSSDPQNTANAMRSQSSDWIEASRARVFKGVVFDGVMALGVAGTSGITPVYTSTSNRTDTSVPCKAPRQGSRPGEST